MRRRGPSRWLTPRERRAPASRENLVQRKGSRGCGRPTPAGSALRPRAGPTTFPGRGAGRGVGGEPDSQAPAALPPSPRTPRGPAAAYSPSRVERGGARHFRAQLRSTRRTGWRRGAGAAAPLGRVPVPGAGPAWERASPPAGRRGPGPGRGAGKGPDTLAHTAGEPTPGSWRAGGGRAGRRRKGWGAASRGRG